MKRPQGKQKERTGVVTSDKMNKTRVVRVVRVMQHPVYKKRIRKFVSFKVHDERNESKIGDIVRIRETRRLSKDKRWRVLNIVESKKE
jgi:small subunit ribosomal protein S17